MKKIKVLIDTNVLVSAAIGGQNATAIVLLIIGYFNDFEWIVSREIMSEYKEVLSRPKLKLSETDKQEWFSLLDESTTMIDVNMIIDFSRDQKDAKFLACAITANANYLITGDQDLLTAQNLETQVVSMATFLEIMQKQNYEIRR